MNPRLPRARALTPAASLPPKAATDGGLERELRDRVAACEGSDHFARLELPRTATPEQVRQRFIDLIKRYHPDRVAGRQKQLLPLANALFFRLKESYDVLSDPQSRARYCETSGRSEGGRRLLDEARAAWLRGRELLARKDFSQAELELRAAIRIRAAGRLPGRAGVGALREPREREESQGEIRGLLARAIQLGDRTDSVFTVAGHFRALAAERKEGREPLPDGPLLESTES